MNQAKLNIRQARCVTTPEFTDLFYDKTYESAAICMESFPNGTFDAIISIAVTELHETIHIKMPVTHKIRFKLDYVAIMQEGCDTAFMFYETIVKSDKFREYCGWARVYDAQFMSDWNQAVVVVVKKGFDGVFGSIGTTHLLKTTSYLLMIYEAIPLESSHHVKGNINLYIFIPHVVIL